MTVIRHLDHDDLDAYRRRIVTAEKQDEMRIHLAACKPCWRAWNRHRWDAARSHPLYSDLQHYLGSDFRPYFDSSRALAAEWDAANPTTPDEAAQFFRTSTSYLYNLVIWQASGHRPQYLDEAIPTLRQLGVRTIVDYGCGVGNDTIPLRQHAFDVTGCDFTSPSTRFLHWRSHNTIPIIEPSHTDDVPAPDALWIIDTLDHIPDIDASLGNLLGRVDIVVTENLAQKRGHSRKQFHRRRPSHQLHDVFAQYGLTPVPASPDAYTTQWCRLVLANGSPRPAR